MSKRLTLPFSLLLGLLLGSAVAERTVAPTPLFSSPALGGQPALTLPSGKPLTSVGRPMGDGKVVRVVYGDQLYYARRGLLGDGSDGISFFAPDVYFLPPQPAGRSLQLPLTWEGKGTAPLAWQVKVLPLAEPELGGEALKLAGGVLKTVPVSLQPAQSSATQTAKATGQVQLGSLKPGLYLVTASRADAPASALGAEVVRVTDLHLAAISSPNRVQVWATHAQTGAALSGVQVSGLAVKRDYSVRTEKETVTTRPLSPVKTDAQGLATFALRDGERFVAVGRATIAGQTHAARLGSPQDELWQGSAERARALIQTDKPVYRPGETLRGLATLRRLSAGKRLPYSGEVTVRLVSGYPSLTLAQHKLKTDADGLVRFNFALPDTVKTGDYSVEVEMPTPPTATNPQPAPDVNWLPVEVRAFVKPLFTLDLSGGREVVDGQPLKLTATGELYQGGAANVTGEVFVLGGSARTGPLYDSSGQEYEGYLPEVDPKRRPDLALKLSGGKATIALNSGPLGLAVKQGFPTDYSVALRARDEYGRDVWASRTVTVYPAALKFAAPQVKPLGSASRVSASVRAVGSNQPLAGRKVTATAVRTYWAGEGQQHKMHEEVLFTRTLTSDGAGRVTADVPLPAGKEGEYALRLSAVDSAGRKAKAEVGAGYVSVRDRDEAGYQLDLSADKAEYRPGETARLTLKTDLPTGTPILLSAHAEERSENRMVKVTGPTMTVNWATSAGLQPAFAVSALAVQRGRLLQAQSDLLSIDRSDQKLTVTVTGGKEVKPGEKATFTVSTSRAGKGVAALVTLAAVHESVYAVAEDRTPEVWDWLWGTTYPQVWVRSSHDQGGDGLGGGGGGDGDLPFRSDLREVAAFQTVQTDASGKATVTVTMPEALGAYRLSARALTRSGAVGEARGVQHVSLPFAVRLIRPRVLTSGDTGSVVVGAVDRSGKSGNVTLSLAAGGQTQTKSLPLQAGAATTTFGVKAGNAALTLQASAVRGKDRDGVQETLPVRPAGNRMLVSGGGTVKGQANVTLKPTGTVESLTLDLAATPLQLALSGLDATLADPSDRWMTTDALSARLRSNLDLAALAGQFGWPDVRERALGQARRDLANLLALRGAGGWGWTAQSKATPEMTAAALTALVQAKGAGLTDSATLQEAQAEATALGSDSVALAAALAQAGVPQRAVRLAAGVSRPTDAARLAAALAPTQPQLAGTLYAKARAAARPDKGGALVLSSPYAWQDDSEPTALLLEAAARLGKAADVPALTQAVLERRVGGAWSGPVGTAAALRALRSVAAREAQPTARTVTVSLGSYQKTLTVVAPTRLVIPAAQVKAQTLTLKASQPTPYAWALRTRRTGAAQTPSPVTIERHYDKTTVARDGIVTVTLTLTTPSRLQHLRVTDPFAGGLEAVDDRPFSEQGYVNAAGSNAVTWADRATYDDRAVFYLEDVKAGKTTIRYRLRALASGDYAAPAPRVDFADGAAAAEGEAQRVKVK